MGEHGTTKRYKLKCRCDLCRAANAAYQREYQERKKGGNFVDRRKEKAKKNVQET